MFIDASYPASPSLQWVPGVNVPHLAGQSLARPAIGTMIRQDFRQRFLDSFAFSVVAQYLLPYTDCFVFSRKGSPQDSVQHPAEPGVLVSRYTFFSGNYGPGHGGPPEFPS